MTPLTPAGQALDDLRAASWVEDAHGEVVLLSDAEDAVAEAADRALAELRREVEARFACEDPEEPCDADGRDEHRWCDNCIRRGSFLALIDKQIGGRDAVPARDDRSNGERDAAGRSTTPVRLATPPEPKP